MLLLLGTAARAPLSYSFMGGALPPGLTFARASAGSSFNSSGVLTPAANNVPRFDYDPVALTPKGILVEPAATNLQLYSNLLTQASQWSQNATTTTNTSPSLDGTNNASLVVPTTTNTLHRVGNAALGVTNGSAYVYSVYAKASGYRYLYINDAVSPNTGQAVFDLIGGTCNAANGTAAITNIGNGWCRCVVKATANFTYATPLLQINNFYTPGDTSFAGDGTSGLLLYGAQLELGAAPTSYIPTTTAAATRAADALSFTVPSGVNDLTYAFDNLTTQKIAASAGAYTVPTNLNRAWIETITGSAS